MLSLTQTLCVYSKMLINNTFENPKSRRVGKELIKLLPEENHPFTLIIQAKDELVLPIKSSMMDLRNFMLVDLKIKNLTPMLSHMGEVAKMMGT